MKARRRRRFREETVAPLVTVLVILGLWWGAWSLLPPHNEEHVVAAAPSAGLRAEPPAMPTAEPAANPRNDVVAPAAMVEPAAAGGAVVPVAGVDAATLTSTFHEARGGGARRHEAMDILAPRGTPVLAAVDGRVVKLFTSAAGGLTIYQFDEEERYCYYYAHLDSYAPDLTEGQPVTRGQIIGFVGTTGNAPPDTPHLHFAIYRLGPDKRWWDGEPLDPLDFLR